MNDSIVSRLPVYPGARAGTVPQSGPVTGRFSGQCTRPLNGISPVPDLP